jgi:ubiquitin C-terminal hydrolase
LYDPYRQQDCQEFLNFILDAVHEDLNHVQEKLQVSEDQSGRTESDIANEYWNVHIKRNSSIVVDLFQGQYKSQIACPDCKKGSMKFEAFMMLTLEIPPKPFEAQFYVMRSDLSKTMEMLELSEDHHVGDVCNILLEKYNINEDHFFVAGSLNGQSVKQISMKENFAECYEQSNVICLYFLKTNF